MKLKLYFLKALLEKTHAILTMLKLKILAILMQEIVLKKCI